MTAAPDRLCKQLGYRFRSSATLQLALTHRSAATQHNERLEFLGDSILGLIISEALYQRFDSTREGELTRLRASLVKGETLAEVARGIELGGCIALGSGELKSGGRDRSSILADAMEALLGAVFLDGGYDAAREVILGLFAARLDALEPDRESKDPKTRLQEWLQARHYALPVYSIASVTGDPHNQHFVVQCSIAEPACETQGEGSSRRRAEQSAADSALAALNHA